PILGEYTQRYTQALLATPFRKEFTEEYGDLMFVNGDIANRAFSPEIIPESIKENELVQEYENLLANARVNFEGKTYTLSEMSLFKSDPDDERRKEAWIADGTWYKENQERLDAIYDELVKLRTSMAKKLGHDNYIPLGYDRMGRNCYHEEEVDQFRKAVREYIVPITSKIYEAQAKRLGKEYPMSFADNELEFRSGNPRPKGGPDDILRAGKKFYDELSPETSKFFNIMLDNELLDVLSKEGKRGGGYCTGLPDYGVPFIFANFNGTQHDVEVVTHEAGHAFEAYTNINRVPSEYIWPSMEGAEVHSMSMEFFAEAWAEDFFGDDAKKFLYSHLAGALKFIPYGTLVDHFQHEVYRNPDMTPRERHDTWKRLMADYMPWEKLDGEIPFYADGEHWQLKHHIYSAPFYYIDYCLAQTVALQFWAMIQEDQKKAWDYYMAYTKLGGSMTFTDLLKTAGLESPFVLETIEKVMKKADTFLENYDLGDIK
ncbi:MAG: M3 family oligoendopeptidase, partial [Solobacterium sp.]|nr:M3 family oligoendopeptidase [Solobacterium sp.]